MWPLFTQERVAASAGLFLDGLPGTEQRKTGWMRAEAAGDPPVPQRGAEHQAAVALALSGLRRLVSGPLAALFAIRARTNLSHRATPARFSGMLRFLDDWTVRPVGDAKKVVDVLLVSATNPDSTLISFGIRALGRRIPPAGPR